MQIICIVIRMQISNHKKYEQNENSIPYNDCPFSADDDGAKIGARDGKDRGRDERKARNLIKRITHEQTATDSETWKGHRYL